MASKTAWDPELYEASHAFVWQMGQGLIDLLEPKPDEYILDLGCGPGQLTQKIAARGAKVLGLDASPEMIGQARQNFPDLQFLLQDAATMNFEGVFDAIFSNAALHWMLKASEVAAAMSRALKTGGRLVAELGGRGNIQKIEAAIRSVVPRYGKDKLPDSRTFFPSVSEYASILETSRFEVRMTHLFDRPTPLEGERGMRNWLRQFAAYQFEGLKSADRNDAEKEVVAQLKPDLYRDGVWYTDYRRLRVIAVKL